MNDFWLVLKLMQSIRRDFKVRFGIEDDDFYIYIDVNSQNRGDGMVEFSFVFDGDGKITELLT